MSREALKEADAAAARFDRLVVWAQLALLAFFLSRFVISRPWSAASPSAPPLRFRLALECSWFVWILFARRIVDWARYRPTGAWPRLRLIAFHLPRVVALSVLFFATKSLLIRAFDAETGTDNLLAALAVVPVQFTTDVLIYVVLAAISSSLAKRLEIEREEEAAHALRTELAETQWQALRARVDPQLLARSLEALAALARERPARAQREVARLGDLLRRYLEDGPATPARAAADIRNDIEKFVIALGTTEAPAQMLQPLESGARA